eukprot:EG_transcript_97
MAAAPFTTLSMQRALGLQRAPLGAQRASSTSIDEMRFTSVEEFVKAMGGSKVIKKVLLANNGMAATKGIRSIQQWAYETFKDSRAIKFVVMATPEDVTANVEYIKVADECVEVPGGPNRNNYANVDLIIDIAQRTKCDAVWVGWGHASENPLIPERLAKTPIVFLGPPASAMRALGDKISSTVVAQSAQVPCIKWSGSHCVLPPGTVNVDEQLYSQCCVKDLEHCRQVAEKVGFPLMIKASEGGGGKGIRMVKSMAGVEDAYLQCCAEIPGSPIFLMQLATGCRHLEVQLLGDRLGNVTSLKTRDCSVQRRHQKIIEEGPVLGTKDGVLRSMEQAAVRLAKLVGYEGVGTVEYLYEKVSGNFYFLELNPRLQVEHPVTEMITNINIPASMLMVGMGIPLQRMPDVRRLYGLDPTGDDLFDLDQEQMPAVCHTIAVRVTAENPDEGFRPTSGKIYSIDFKPSRTTWGYFSIAAPGGVHEFADSQFGHIFSSGESREIARKGMVVALSQLRIEGEIRTTFEYVMNLLERPEFTNCDVSTSWLDGLLASKEPISQPIPHVTVVCGAIHKMNARQEKNHMEYLAFLQSGHAPSNELLSQAFTEVLILNNMKYTVKGFKLSPTTWELVLNEGHLRVQTRILTDRGVLVYLGRESYLTTAENDPNGLRVVVNGKTAQFTNDEDPCSLRTTVPGKLVRYLVSDGDFIESGMAYAEIEVMKMILQLKTNISGTVTLKAVAGTAVNAGKILAQIEPLDGTQIIRPDEYTQAWPADALQSRYVLPDALSDMREAVTGLHNILAGYKYPPKVLEAEVRQHVEKLCRGCDAPLQGLGLAFLNVTPEGDADHPSRLVFLIRFFLEMFWSVEAPFDLQHEDVAVLALCKRHAGDLPRVAEVMKAHCSPDKGVVALALAALAEAKGLVPPIKEVLEKIATLSNVSNNRVVLQAKHLLRRMHLPSFNEMVADLHSMFEKGVDIQEMLYQSRFTSRMIISLMRDASQAVAKQALDLLVRRNYSAFELQDMEITGSDDTMRARWSHALGQSVAAAAVAQNLAAFSDMGIGDEGAAAFMAKREWGLMFVFRTVDMLLERFERDVMLYMMEDEELRTHPSVVEILVGGHVGNALDERLEKLMADKANAFTLNTGCQRITFRLGIHSFFTFRRVSQFKEDIMFRDVAPTLAVFLELSRLSNYVIETYPLRGRGLRMYFAKEKMGMRMLPLPQREQDRRFFLRMLAIPDREEGHQFSATTLEYIISEAIQILEVAMSDSKYSSVSNHLFVNFIEQHVNVDELDALLGCLYRYLKQLHKLYLTDIELKITTSDSQRIRIFVHNPSGYVPHTEVYYERMKNWKLYLEPAESLGGLSSSPSKTLRPLRHCPSDPHPLLTAVDRKRLAAQKIGTTYVYDWAETFSVCVKEMWAKAVQARPGLAGFKEAMPQAPVVATEFVLEGGVLVPKPVSDCNNNCGMVCWEFDFFLPTRYRPETQTVPPKKVMVVANDISYQSGSFAIEEDDVFNAAGQRAKEKGLPLVYLASNSGARIGMAQEVKDVYRVMFADPEHPEKGFEYLYVEEADYQRLSTMKSINATPAVCPHSGRTIYRLKDVIGVKDGLGVENLSGSGLIAGQMSSCYATVPTLSLASGRSVGIGAYLNRLGRRVVQVVGSPMILTGAAALNKLLGKEVYKSNNQLGGCPVMSPNGVTHWEVADDYAGCDSIVQWLDFMPEQFPGAAAPDVPVPGPHFQLVPDPWDRDVLYSPTLGEVADPRFLITGLRAADGRLVPGLFDADSWQETLSKWATTVVAGRAKLGGLPVGIIAVETRTQEKILPADPADVTSVATVRSQAGNVWFPDSARKTADCIQDFQKEGLPCFILANWRGFSGGQRDMFDEVLKFGASIVDNLREYDQPVFVYLPPHGDLRGGAWVVIDYHINPDCIEMYADETSHAGVLEPSGLIEVKYRDSEIVQSMHRLDPVCKQLLEQQRASKQSMSADIQQRLRAREELLAPIYKSIATELAALHDTPGRMLAKGAIQGILDWRNSRRFFYQRLRRRQWEFSVLRRLRRVAPGVTLKAALQRLQEWCGGVQDDAALAQWCEEHAAVIEERVQTVWKEMKAGQLMAECRANPLGQRALLLQLLQQYRESGADVAELRAVLAAP